jgi:hypothetical protein
MVFEMRALTGERNGNSDQLATTEEANADLTIQGMISVQLCFLNLVLVTSAYLHRDFGVKRA